MKKSFFVFLLTLILSAPISAQQTSSPGGAVPQFPIMRPDPVTLQKWMDDYETAPRADLDPVIHSYLLQAQAAATPTSLSLLNHIKYTPSERNQGNCGDCWVWASTGAMEIALSVQNGVLDRLSTQFLNSCKTDSYACCGGNLSGFSTWYASKGLAIPWSNTNANFQDTSRGCGNGSSLDSCVNISTTPNYPITSILPTTVQTTGFSGDATPIANIKNFLNQGYGVVFAYFLANQTDWNDFFSFWNNNDETVIWNPEPYCGHTWDTNTGGGHAVLIVGYDDSDLNSANHYWIVLNSWGTAGGRRPNGLFRMKMHMKYNCTLEGVPWTARQFQTLNMAFNVVGPPSNPCDFDGDGNTDIVWRNKATGQSTMWLMNGTALKNWGGLTGAIGPDWEIVGTGHFNNDAMADIVWRNKTTGESLIWLMNGMAMTNWASLTGPMDTNWEIVGKAKADFNGDGKTDILWRNKATGESSIWLMNGTAVISWAMLTGPTDTNWEIVAVNDFNGDGKADILWRNKATGQSTIWLMNGTTVTSWAGLTGPMDTNWEIVETGSFNNDAMADIVWRNKATGQSVIWLMNGTAMSTWAGLTGPMDTNWEIVGTGSFNNDAVADIVWRNKATGQSVIWLMNGTAMSTWAGLTGPMDTNWEIIAPKSK